ncbi:MAG TPA: exodeoxyribonuclease VII large subunit [Chthoniobacterales bacterium]
MQADFFQQTAKVLTVAELTRAIRGTLETRFGSVWVQGEISNYKLHPSGHQYFTLKDQRAQIACVIFRNTLPPNSRPLVDGAHVQVFGNISVFEARGQYQLSVQIVQDRGAGLLQAKFEALKRKLEAQGFFDTARKRPLPKFPQRIGIVTSPSGAAIRDMLNVLQRRAPNLEIIINPVRVQGVGAAQEIAVAIRELATPNESFDPVDLIVVTRGGGSIEDLWEFNEEIVARAIFESAIPIVSAVGHEIDFTICDFVADLRAPTPSAAAELIVQDASELQRRIDELRNCLRRYLQNFIEQSRTRLQQMSERVLRRELATRMNEARQRLDWLRESLTKDLRQSAAEKRQRLTTAMNKLQAHSPAREIILRRSRFANFEQRLRTSAPHLLEHVRQRFTRAERVLRVLGPDATLERGYTITTNADGEIIRSTASVHPGVRLRTRVRDGTIDSDVV